MLNLSHLSRERLERIGAAIHLAKRRQVPVPQFTDVLLASESQEVKLTTWTPQPGPQAAFYNCWADICVYGGSAYSGKTAAILMEPAKYLSNPNFNCVTFRRTSPQITNPGGLWDDSQKLYPLYGGVPVKGLLEWRFPSGAKIVYRHLEHDETRTEWSGAQINLLQFDELFTFSSKQFWFLTSRNRSASGVRPYVRATTNPDPDSWLADFLAWWIDQDSGFPILERSGVIRWLVRNGEELVWFDEHDYYAAKHYVTQLTKEDRAEPKSVTFIPGKIDDNQIGLAANPDYINTLHALPYVEKMQLLYGNWKVRPAAGKVFNRAWFEIVDAAPTITQKVRYWDLAASGPGEGDASCGVKLALSEQGLFYVVDVVHGRWTPLERDQVIKQTAQMDGVNVALWIEQEPGSSGKSLADALVRMLAGFYVQTDRVTGDKVTRAQPFAAQVQAGNVKVVSGAWNRAFLDELHAFPEGAHDDQCLVAGTQILTEDGEMPIESIRAGVRVMTREGLRSVQSAGMTQPKAHVLTLTFSDGSTLSGTAHHPIWIAGRGFVHLEKITIGDNIERWKQRESFFVDESIAAIPLHHIATCASIIGGISLAQRRRLRSIVQSGWTHMARFLPAALSIIKMETRSIIRSIIWFLLPTVPICEHMAWGLEKNNDSTWNAFETERKCGTSLQRDTLGILPMRNGHLANSVRARRSVINAANATHRPGVMSEIGFARSPVGNDGALCIKHDINTSGVSNVGENFLPRIDRKPVPVNVVRVCVGDTQPVYNLTVAGTPEYFANGILVHNCDAASGAFNQLAGRGFSPRVRRF